MKPVHESPSENPVFQSRLIVVYLGVLIWGLLILVRLIWLQGFRSDHYLELARDQQKGYSEVAGRRGEVLDRKLGELAVTVEIDSLIADPTLVTDPEGAAEALSAAIGYNREELSEALSKESRFVRLIPRLPPSQTAQVRDLGLQGIFVDPVNHRFYPGQQLAASLLGFVGADDVGLGGLEYLYDEEIRGQPQRIYYDFDGKRRRMERVSEDVQNEGHKLVLNLDRSIQFITEQALAEAIEQHEASNGSAIVMDPRTGEILAMASWPPFDPNRFSEYENEDFTNRGILQMYEPGSTFKIMTLSAVLNEGLSDLDEVIDCRAGTLTIAGKTYREATHSFEDLSLRQIVAKSSNIGTIKLALRLGKERLYHYIRRFGFGEKTGVDLPGEQLGLLRSVEHWSRISIGAHAIGQEIAVTPLQILRAVSAVANGGYLVEPHVVNRIHTSAGDLVRELKPHKRRILRESTTRLMKEALGLVVEDGTGSAARLERYSSGGKTGTAQKFIDGQYSKTHYVASYVGFAPLDEPRLAAVVVIDEPLKGLYYGGRVAGPAFKQIMEQSLLSLKIPQDRNSRTPNLAYLEGSELLDDGGVPIEQDRLLPKEHLEKTVLSLIQAKKDASGSAVITVERGWRIVPDFTGKSLRQVAREVIRHQLKVRFSGNGTVIGQRPQPGSRVKSGAVCEVFFASKGAPQIATRTAVAESSAAKNWRNP